MTFPSVNVYVLPNTLNVTVCFCDRAIFHEGTARGTKHRHLCPEQGWLSVVRLKEPWVIYSNFNTLSHLLVPLWGHIHGNWLHPQLALQVVLSFHLCYQVLQTFSRVGVCCRSNQLRNLVSNHCLVSHHLQKQKSDEKVCMYAPHVLHSRKD